jgi:hypothetical protein
MINLAVDAKGRLRGLTVMPPQLDSSLAAEPNHTATLFALAGLDTAAFHEVTPTWVPLPAFDHRREWVGPHPTVPGATARHRGGGTTGRGFVWQPWDWPTACGAVSSAIASRAASSCCWC